METKDTNTPMKPSDRLPPGPKGHFFLGNIPEFRKDPLTFFTSCAREYGDVVRLRFYTMPYYLFSHPDAVEEVLVIQNQHFTKSWDYRYLLRDFTGDGLLISEGESWLHQHRLASPSFHPKRVDTYTEVMVAQTERMLANWKDGETLDIQSELLDLTLEIVNRVLFGADVEREAAGVRAALAVVMECLHERIRRHLPVPTAVPTPANLRFVRAIRRLDDIVYGLIQARRESEQDTGDLLSMFLHAQAEDGSRMTDRQLRDEVMTFFVAGYENPALALTWAFYLLTQHPEVDAALRAELRTVLGGRAPTVGDLANLRYTEKVISEAMRIRPPLWILGREAQQDLTIAGYRVPKGTQIAVSQWVVHHDPRWFKDPEQFIPERWTDDFQQTLPRYAYFPFGGGTRHCLGAGFASKETMLLLATIAQRFQFHFVPGHPVELMPSVTLRPKYGIKVTLSEASA